MSRALLLEHKTAAVNRPDVRHFFVENVAGLRQCAEKCGGVPPPLQSIALLPNIYTDNILCAWVSARDGGRVLRAGELRGMRGIFPRAADSRKFSTEGGDGGIMPV